MPPKLRPYQVEAISSVFKRWNSGQRRTAGVAATGAGKTVILSALIQEHLKTDPRPVLVLAHRQELIEQAAEKIQQQMPRIRVGRMQAGKHQHTAPVIVGSVQTLAPRDTEASRRRWVTMPQFGLVIVDECHRSVSPAYLRTLTALGCLRPDGPLTAGFTATFTREDSARLTDFWESVAFSVDIMDLVDQGFLVPPRFRRVLVEGLDLSSVATSRIGGSKEFAAGELSQALLDAGAPGIVAAAYKRHAASKSGIVFTPNVESAYRVAEAFQHVGITAEAIDGKTSGGNRKDILRRYAAGELQVVVNCNILGEGFDAPRTEVVVIARPTLSKILFRQMVGRGLRPFCVRSFPNICAGCDQCKPECLVLDLVGATGRQDLATLDDVVGVHVEDGESAKEAVKRERAEPVATVGDAEISGSLTAVDVDPWEAERRRKLSQAERIEEGLEEPPPVPEPEEPKTPRRRYVSIEQRDGWALMSPAGHRFIPLTAGERSQKGVVALWAVPGGTRVLAGMENTSVQHIGTYEDEQGAMDAAMAMVWQLLETGAERALTDPDARWRRRTASESAIRLAEKLCPWAELDETAYAGVVADYITLATHGRIADRFVAEMIVSDAPMETV